MSDEIVALAVRSDASMLVACWPPRPCVGCQRSAALGIIRLGTTEPRRNEFRCVECDESALPAPNCASETRRAPGGVSVAGPAVTSAAATAADTRETTNTRGAQA